MATLTERDLRRILTHEERNAITIVGGAKNETELGLVARRMSLDPVRLRALVEQARGKIAREARKAATVEEVTCGCGQEFTPRRKGQLQCPACAELNGDGRPLTEPRSNGRSDHRETDHGSDHESAQLDAPEASPDEAPDNGDVARNPPPAQPFPSSTSAEERRAKIVQAVRDAGGECKRDTIREAVGYGDPALGNDLTALASKGLLVKVPIGPRRAIYRTPEHEATTTRREMTGEGAPAPDRRELILDFIGEHERVSTMDVTLRHPSVTYQTIKTDLDALHREGKIVKRRGAQIEWRLVDGTEEGEPPYFEGAVQEGLTDAERAAAAAAAEVEVDENGFEWPDPPTGWRYKDDGPDDQGMRTIERTDGVEEGDPFFVVNPNQSIERQLEEAAAKADDVIVKHVNVGQSISEDGRLAVELHTEPESSIPPENETPPEPTVIVHGPFEQGTEPPAIDVLRQRAADTAQQLMAEAERLAEAADMAVPETLLRARYIAALLHRIEAGGTSPDLLDRFERLAFD